MMQTVWKGLVLTFPNATAANRALRQLSKLYRRDPDAAIRAAKSLPKSNPAARSATLRNFTGVVKLGADGVVTIKGTGGLK
jgi:hypothetical protein